MANSIDRDLINESSLEILYEYSGAFTHEVLKEIGTMINETLFTDQHPKVIKQVFACSNELVQNVGFYSVDRVEYNDDTIGAGKMRILSNDKIIIFEASNKVEKSRGERLIDKINELNSWDSEELKRVYKEKIKGQSDEHSKGAGIGFIEIIKRTKNPVLAELEIIDEDFAFITIKSIINKEV